MRPSLCVSALVASVAALTSASATPALNPIGDEAVQPRSGLRGVVYRGPIMPVCVVGIPCEAPAAGVTLTFTRSRAAAVRARTGADGSYRVLLPPAIYSVRIAMQPRILMAPTRVKVRSGHIDRLDFHIDTGIR